MPTTNLADIKRNRQELESIINSLEIGDLEKRFMRSRWLNQVNWYDRRAVGNRNWYYVLRTLTIIGGVLVPALVTLTRMQNVVFFIGLIVAISTGIESFFNFGGRWRNFRRTAENLKVEGWLFLQLSGPYESPFYKNHADAYHAFANRVEEIIQFEVKVYLSEIVAKQEKKDILGKPNIPDDSGAENK